LSYVEGRFRVAQSPVVARALVSGSKKMLIVICACISPSRSLIFSIAYKLS